MRNCSQHLNEKVDLQYCPHGHLVLASEKYAERLEHNIQIQREYGVKNELLTVEDIKMRFPYLNTEDISIGKHPLLLLFTLFLILETLPICIYYSCF